MQLACFSRAPWLFLALASLAGCRSQYDVDDICETQAKKICSFQFECCWVSERPLIPTGGIQDRDYHTETECVEAYTKFFCAQTAQIVESVERGRSTWDTEKAEACYGPLFEAYDTCDAEGVFFPEGAPHCDEIVRGTLGSGKACRADHECESGFCNPEVKTDAQGQILSIGGNCVALPGEGAPCQDGRCSQGLVCDSASERCAKPKKSGAPCILNSECDSLFCAEGNVCADPKQSGVRIQLCDGLDR